MNSMKSVLTGSLLGLGLFLAAGQSAHATQAVWDNSFTPAGWTRGVTPGSHYAEWNIFNDNGAAAGIQDSSPEVSLFGAGSYTLAETTTAGFLTSGGNIYNPTVPTAFTLTAGNLGGGVSDVFLRVATLGDFNTTLNQSLTGFTLNGIAGTYSQLFNEAISGGFGGNEVEAVISWLGVTHTGSFTIAFNAAGSSASLDQLSLDVNVAPVPVPAAAWLMASGLTGIVAMARRKQSAA